VRILLVIEPSGGGSGRHVIDLAQMLIDGGHAVSLIYSPTRAEPLFEAEAAALPLEHLERLPMRRAVGPSDVGVLFALRRLMARLGPFDIVHGHSAKAGALVRLAAPAKAARIYTPHALATQQGFSPASAFYGLIETLLAHSSSEAVIAVSDDEARHARGWRFPTEKLHVVLNGLAPPPAATDRLAARAALGVSDDVWVVGFVGRLCAQKDPVRFAQALRLARLQDPTILGVVVGDGALGDDVRAAGSDAIRMVGARNARMLAPGFDLFAMTSLYEGFSYAMVEAAVAGLPILTTEVGGVSALVETGASIDRLPVDATPQQLAQAMIAIRGRSAAPTPAPTLINRFSVSRMAAETVAIYRQAYARRRRVRG